MQARYDYAEAAFAAGDRDAAADELLAMVETDREWNEGAARAKLLQISIKRVLLAHVAVCGMPRPSMAIKSGVMAF